MDNAVTIDYDRQQVEVPLSVGEYKLRLHGTTRES